MHEDRSERALRTHFRRQRSEDEQRAPSFDALVRSAATAPVRRRPTPVWLRFAGAAAAAAGLVMALDLGGMSPHGPATNAETWSALSQWSAPTDSFLEWSGSQGLGAAIDAPTDLWLGFSQQTGVETPSEKETQ